MFYFITIRKTLVPRANQYCVWIRAYEGDNAPLIPKSGVKFTVFVQICPRIGGLLSKFMQQSIKFHESSFRVQPFSGFNL